MSSLPHTVCSVMVEFYPYSICPNSHVSAEKLGDVGLSVHPTYPQYVYFGLPTHPDSHALNGHEATDIGLAYAPVSQAHGHNHIVQCFSSLHCSADQFCTTPGGC